MTNDILFVNHEKTQCGVYEIGKRIYNILDKNILPMKYVEVPVWGLSEYLKEIEKTKPSYVIYNYYPSTMPFLKPSIMQFFPEIKHLGIIHDPLDPGFISFIESMFDAWIIHDRTNPIKSNKKFMAFRPIPRFEKKIKKDDGRLKIGSHGFNTSPWKMFDTIIKLINLQFDEVDINMNIAKATFSNHDELSVIPSWSRLVTKKDIKLNITTDYLSTEAEVVEFLSKNTLNVYFYNPPSKTIGVGGSADLAVAAQSSLLVNNTYMYRHFHEKLGFYEQTNNMLSFINNRDLVKDLYTEWSPEAISLQYKEMLELV